MPPVDKEHVILATLIDAPSCPPGEGGIALWLGE